MNLHRYLRYLLLALCLSVGHIALAQDYQEEEPLPMKDVQRFTTAIGQIKSYYVEDVDDADLFENAIRGMLAGLDPHSAYLDEDDFSDLKVSTSGEFTGLGIEIALEDGFIKIISPIDDTPAKKAGLQPGDVIIRLDDTSIKGMTLRDAVKKMRGRKGTSIILTIVRRGEKQPLKITVTRDTIRIQSVKSRLLDTNYAYIRISHFQASTAKDLVEAINHLKQATKGSLRGLVLDLRNNPGGLLDAAIQVSDIFLHSSNLDHNKLIVYTKGRIPESKFDAKATPGDLINGAPMVVLANEGSASASEIVAGALQDHHRAIIMGTSTFGKGSVQSVLPLDDTSGIKLTTALYYTPAGRSIQAEGIHPDVVVENISLPKESEQQDDFMAFVKEIDLNGHIANGNAPKASSSAQHQTQTPTQVPSNKMTLAKNDFQLYEALNLLKGINALYGG